MELWPGATENFASMKHSEGSKEKVGIDLGDISGCRLCDQNLENPEPCQGHQASIDFGTEFLGFGK